MNDLINDGPVDEALSAPPSHGLLCLSPIVTPQCRRGPQMFSSLECYCQCFPRHTGAPVCLQSPVCSRLTQLLVLNSFIFGRPTCTHSLKIMSGTVVVFPQMSKPWEDTFMPPVKCMHFWSIHYIRSFKEEQSGIHFLVHSIQHNLNFSAAKPNWPCSFTYMSLYTHAMYFVACMYEYETYGFIHDMLDLWLRHSY